MLVNGHLRHKAVVLVTYAQVLAPYFIHIFADGLEVDLGVTTRGCDLACQHLQQRGLAGSTVAHEGQDLTLPNLEIQLPLYTYKGFWMSHCPIHSDEMRNRIGNIHGHTHKHSIDDERYYNVSLDVHDYKFIEFDMILEKFKKGE